MYNPEVMVAFKTQHKPKWVKHGHIAVAKWYLQGLPIYSEYVLLDKPATGGWMYEAS
jgi:hypothetical protein